MRINILHISIHNYKKFHKLNTDPSTKAVIQQQGSNIWLSMSLENRSHFVRSGIATSEIDAELIYAPQYWRRIIQFICGL